MVLTGRAALVAALGVPVVAVVRPDGIGVLLWAAMLAVLVVVDALLAAPVRPLAVRRSGDTVARLGTTATVHLVVANLGRRRLRGVVRDAWGPSAGAWSTRHAIDLRPGDQRRLSTVLTPTRRGDRQPDRVTVRSLGPLRLAGRQGSHEVPWRLRVLPPFASRRHLPSRLARLRELDGRSAVRQRGEGTEFDSLRDYVDGDDVRAIDWRATARRQAVVVRTWRPERDRRLLVVLDTGRTCAGRVGDAPRLDASMDAALLLAALASRAGDRVDLVAHDRTTRVRVLGATAGQLLPTLVDAMAPLEPSLVESDPSGLVAAALTGGRRYSLVVVLTDLTPAAMAEGLLDALVAVAARSRVLVGAVADPRLAELAAGRTDAAAVYGAAAAERSRSERATVAAQLRRLGVAVVDAAPEDLPPALADAYLALKAAGRL